MSKALPKMSFNRKGKAFEPLAVFEIGGRFIVGVYQGKISEFDILVKYRQKLGNKWSNLRTPKHIHWAVDMLIKLHKDRAKTQEFLGEFIRLWNATVPMRSADVRVALLGGSLLEGSKSMAKRYESLNSKGEYSVLFLILLAKLLMVQEKTNREDAFMFGKVLEALEKGKDIFGIVSSATFNGR